MTLDDDPKRGHHGEDGASPETDRDESAEKDDDAQPSESELDEQLEDTFPASDPPANY